jgi:hypothetical protein
MGKFVEGILLIAAGAVFLWFISGPAGYLGVWADPLRYLGIGALAAGALLLLLAMLDR